MNDLVRETKVLFLTIKAVRMQSWSSVLFEALEQLCRSSNAAIANRAHMLTAELCGEKRYG